MQTYRIEEIVKFPALVSDQGSLTPTERLLLGSVLLLVRPRVICELGVLQAVTTQFICAFLDDNEIDGHVFGFDLPEVVEVIRTSHTGVQQCEENHRLTLVPGRLPDSLRSWLASTEEPVDLAFVDAMHDYRSVIAELNLLWPRLAPDGYILCHDYSSTYQGVRYAVDRFAAQVDAQVLPLTSSVRARQHGHASVLVALRRRSPRMTIRSKAHHRWDKAKKDLMEYPVVHRVWHDVVKPLVRREKRGP